MALSFNSCQQNVQFRIPQQNLSWKHRAVRLSETNEVSHRQGEHQHWVHSRIQMLVYLLSIKSWRVMYGSFPQSRPDSRKGPPDLYSSECTTLTKGTVELKCYKMLMYEFPAQNTCDAQLDGSL